LREESLANRWILEWARAAIAVYSAAQAWDVTAFDRRAKALASLNLIRIRRREDAALVARDDEFEYGQDEWDLIVMTYVRD
jgi:methylase of polypeptide subunit release factors